MRRRRGGGFTLIEVAFSTAALTVVLGGAFYVLSTAGRNVWLRTDAALASRTGAQAALDRLIQELRSSSRSSADKNTPIGATPGTWRFVFHVDADEDVNATRETKVEYRYFPEPNKQYIQRRTAAAGTNGPWNARIVVRHVTGSTLTWDAGSGVATVTVTVATPAAKGYVWPQTLTSSVNVRNP